MEFKQAVITKQGRELMAKLLAGGTTTQFTKIVVSSTVYSDAQLENLTALTNIKMTAPAQAYGNNTATVAVTAAIENTGLTAGFYVNTVGLYAVDPQKGEILYSVSSAKENGYMPADTGVSKSGFNFKIYVEIGNASQVNLEVDPAAYATQGDLERLKADGFKVAYANSPDGKVDFRKSYHKNIAGGSFTEWVNTTFSTRLSGTVFGSTTEIKGIENITCAIEINAAKSPQRAAIRVSFTDANDGYISEKVGTWVESGTRGISVVQTEIPSNAVRVNFRLMKALEGTDCTFDYRNLLMISGKVDNPIFLPTKKDNPLGSIMRYQGIALEDTDDPKKFIWEKTNDYQDYLNENQRKETFKQLATFMTNQSFINDYHTNFAGKTLTSANPHAYYWGNVVSLGSPVSSPGTELEDGSKWNGYDYITNLDGNAVSNSINENGRFCRHVIMWDIRGEINRQLPKLFPSLGLTTVQQQVDFIKSVFVSGEAIVYAVGSGKDGNAIYFNKYLENGTWSSSASKSTINAYTKLVQLITSSSITAGGKIYLTVYSDPSDGITASRTAVDYTNFNFSLDFKVSDFLVPKSLYQQEIGAIKTWIQNQGGTI